MFVILLIAFCINMIVTGVVVAVFLTTVVSLKRAIKKLQVKTSSIYFMNRLILGKNSNEYVKNRTQQEAF